MSIPFIDLQTASPIELVDGLISSSCVFVHNHGLTDAERTDLLDSGADFYARSDAEKSAVRWSGQGPWLGWQPVHQGGPSALLLERFEVCLQPGASNLSNDDWARTFDLWPAEPVGMARAWTTVYRRLHELSSTLTSMIAEGLGLPVADLAAWTVGQHSNLVLNHYQSQHYAPEQGRVRQRPHSDIGGITLLWADNSPGGLEAHIGPDGSWVPVEFGPGALLLQAGDLLNLWSDGRIPANLHRVVNPPRTAGVDQSERYSMVFFHHPDLSTWVAPNSDSSAPADRGVDARTHVLARQDLSARLDSAAT